jgi:tetratricopeptide (TPR) repeat protein
MKIFRKKNKNPSLDHPQSAKTAANHGGYSKHTGEVPLDEYFDASNARHIQHTSRHSPARRRENDNRASRWAISMLLFRGVLIVLLLTVGFVVLKLVLNRMEEPSERQKQQWEAKASRMEVSSTKVSAVSPAGVGPEGIKQRLDLWEQARRHLRSADALNRQGIDDDAIQRLDQALRVMPESQVAQQMLVDIYLRKGRYAEAVPVCIRLLDQDSDKPELQMKLLQALQASGQTEAGLVLAQRMLEDRPNDLNILSIAAAGQVGLGDTDAALGLFGRMLNNDTKNKEALKNCGEIYFKRGAYQQAVPYYLDLVRLDSKPEYYQMLARCYAQQNEAGKAIIFMGQASSLFGSSAVAPWLKETVFDPVRETVEFRSFADRIIGIETRTAIEAINKREAEKTRPSSLGEGLTLPNKGDLNAITPRK